MASHSVVSKQEWVVSRKELLIKEKALTQLGDEVSALRRALPWVKVEKNYQFNGPRGKQNLNELFNGKRQLLIYHFMLGPEWQEGCPSCSFWADNFDGIDIHLAHRDISFLVVSRARYESIENYKQRMGWGFNWVSSHGNDFNYDYDVSFSAENKNDNEISYNYKKQAYFIDELPGVSVFYRDQNGQVFHTYSTYARGLDALNGAYQYIDLTPKGRNENNQGMSAWLRRHDQY